MRRFFLTALIASALSAPGLAQEATPDRGVWAAVNGVSSADLAIRGWSLAGTTGVAAGPETGLLVTFWRAADGSLARCVFSLVSAKGTQAFETCSIATTASATPAETTGTGAGQ